MLKPAQLGQPFLALIWHDGKPHTWPELLHAWSFEPIVVFSLLLTAGLFFTGLFKLWKGSPKQKLIGKPEALCFVGGWLALALALVSPLHAWGSVLFSAHMTQHEVLMLIAAPLLVLGRPLLPFMWALPLGWSRRLGNTAK